MPGLGTENRFLSCVKSCVSDSCLLGASQLGIGSAAEKLVCVLHISASQHLASQWEDVVWPGSPSPESARRVVWEGAGVYRHRPLLFSRANELVVG